MLLQRMPSSKEASHAYSKKKIRRCKRCGQFGYWTCHLCGNQECCWSYKRDGAYQYAEWSFKRKVWRRAVLGKGKLGPKVEKALKDKKFDQTDVGM